MMNDGYDTITIEATEPVFGAYIGWIQLRVHHPSKCAMEYCCIHNPSPHHMVTWPQLWRDDRQLMERTCPHGVGHPDPDGLEFRRRRSGDKAADTAGIHGCDGCCGVDL